MGQKKTVSSGSAGGVIKSGTLIVLAIGLVFLAALAVIFVRVPRPPAPTGEASPRSPAEIQKDGALTASVRAEPRTFNRRRAAAGGREAASRHGAGALHGRHRVSGPVRTRAASARQPADPAEASTGIRLPRRQAATDVDHGHPSVGARGPRPVRARALRAGPALEPGEKPALLASRSGRSSAAGARQDYAVAAASLGASPARVLWVHLLPAACDFLAVQATVLASAFIVAEATLSYVGFGFPDTVASWGTMLQEASNVSAVADFPCVLVPALAIFVVTLSVNLIVQPGDTISQEASPRTGASHRGLSRATLPD